MANLSSVLHQLQQERRRLTSQLESLSNALSALGAIGRRRMRMSAGRRMSASAIARIRAAQKKRWAKWRKQQKKR